MSEKITNKEIQQAEREMLMAKYQTALKKGQLINDLKSGLGKEIKENGGKVKIIKPSWFERLVIKLKKNIYNFLK